MGRRPATLVVALLAVGALALVAGCAAPAGEEAALPVDTGPFAAATPLPPEGRETVWSVTMHEEVDDAAVDLEDVTGDDAWPPRDVALTYHGVQETYDEFARPVASFVFRYPAMVFVAEDAGFEDGEFRLQGHYEAHDWEFAFDAADGRLVSVADVTDGLRAWNRPESRAPLASLPVAAMAWKVFQETGRREAPLGDQSGHTLLYNFTPAPGDRPLPGECDPYRLTMRWDPSWPAGPVGLPEAELEDYRTLICTQPGEDVPLWAFDGTNQSSYRLQRTGPSIPLPEFRGEPLLPAAYERAPWQELQAPLPVPGPMLLPPASDGGLWAGEVAERAAALHYSPSYLKYRVGSGTPFPVVAFLNTDLALIEVLGVRIPPPVLGVRSSLFWLDDGAKAHLHWVYTRHGGAERPDLHVADPNGYDIEDLSGGEGFSADLLPPLVPDGAAQGQLSPLLPEVVDTLAFSFFWFDLDGDGFEADELPAVWAVFQSCTAEKDGWVVGVDAAEGAVSFTIRAPAAPDCPDGQPPLEALAALRGAPNGPLHTPTRMPGTLVPWLLPLSATTP